MASNPFLQAYQLFSSGKFAEADTKCKNILATNPNHIDALNLRAVILCKARQFPEAIELLRRVLARDRLNAQALSVLGDALDATGRYGEAADSYLALGRLKRNDVHPWVKRGAALYHAGLVAEAAESYARAVEVKANVPDDYLSKTYVDYAVILLELGKTDLAEAILKQSIAKNQKNRTAWTLIADLYHKSQNLAAAADAYRGTVSLGLTDAAVHYNYGKVLFDLKRYDDAISECDAALKLRPLLCNAHSLRASALRMLGRLEEAELAARRAVQLKPDDPIALTELATIVDAFARHDEALTIRQRAFDLMPSDITMTNLGISFDSLGDAAKALTILEEAAGIYPNNPVVQANLGYAYLRNRRFEDGWKAYAWRIRGELETGRFRRYARFPRWQGQPIASGRLLVWGEQGIGDEVMFSGLIPRLLDTGVPVVLESDPRLVKTFARSFPSLECLAETDDDDFPTDIAAAVPAGDLFGILRPDRTPSPWLSSGFLRADTEARARLRARYGEDRPLVGIAWRSSNSISGRLRSLPEDVLRRLTENQDATFVSLQYGDSAKLQEEADGRILVDADIDQLKDIDSFVAQVAAMDAVITIDNTTVHVAGALNLPTLLLLPSAADWRWFRGTTESAWYPTVALLRQAAPGDWGTVIDEAKTRIRQRFWQRTGNDLRN